MVQKDKSLIALLVLIFGLIVLSALWALQLLDALVWLIVFTV